MAEATRPNPHVRRMASPRRYPALDSSAQIRCPWRNVGTVTWIRPTSSGAPAADRATRWSTTGCACRHRSGRSRARGRRSAGRQDWPAGSASSEVRTMWAGRPSLEVTRIVEEDGEGLGVVDAHSFSVPYAPRLGSRPRARSSCCARDIAFDSHQRAIPLSVLCSSWWHGSTPRAFPPRGAGAIFGGGPAEVDVVVGVLSVSEPAGSSSCSTWSSSSGAGPSSPRGGGRRGRAPS